MNLSKLASVSLLALAFAAGCKGGPEGTYKLDKASVKKAMEEEIAKKPKEEQGFAALAVAMIEAMDMQLEVKSGGKYDMKMSMPSLGGKDGEKKEETESGDWTVEGDTITLKGKKEAKCKFDSSKIECSGDKPGEPKLIFTKS